MAAERVRNISLVLAYFAFHKHRSKCIGSCWLVQSWRWPESGCLSQTLRKSFPPPRKLLLI